MRWFATVMILLVAAPGWAQQPQADPADERALRELHREFVAAYDKGDAAKLAAFYEPDADFVDIRGDAFRSRGKIEARMANFFDQHKGVKLNSPFGSLRFLTRHVAIADRSEELTPPIVGGPSRVQTTVVYVKRDGKWLQASVRLSVAYQAAGR